MQKTLLERRKSWEELGLTEDCMSSVDHEHTFNTVMNNGEKLAILTSIETKATTWFPRKPHFSIKRKHIILTAYKFSINVCAVLYESGSDYCQSFSFEKGGIRSLKQLSIVTKKTPLFSLYSFLYTRKGPTCEDHQFSGKSLWNY